MVEKDTKVVIFNHLKKKSKMFKRPRDTFRFYLHKILDQVLWFFCFNFKFSFLIHDVNTKSTFFHNFVHYHSQLSCRSWFRQTFIFKKTDLASRYDYNNIKSLTPWMYEAKWFLHQAITSLVVKVKIGGFVRSRGRLRLCVGEQGWLKWR